MTALVAETVVVLVAADEHVAALPAEHLARGVSEDLFRRAVPENDATVAADDESAVTRAAECLIERGLNKRHGFRLLGDDAGARSVPDQDIHFFSRLY